MTPSAWSHWHPATIEGHAAELTLLREHFDDISFAEPAMCDGLPGVVAVAEGQLVTAAVPRGIVRGEGRCEVRVDGPSASMAQGPAIASYVAVPFALAAAVLVNGTAE